MTKNPHVTIHRKDYTAPAYWVNTVEMGFDLDPAATRMIWGRSLTDVRSVHFSFRLKALPRSDCFRMIPLRDQRIIKTHEQLARVPSPSERPISKFVI